METEVYLFADDNSLLEYSVIQCYPLRRLIVTFHAYIRGHPNGSLHLIQQNRVLLFSQKKLNRPVSHDLYLGQEKLIEVFNNKQLGVTFNNKMTFNDHIDQCVEKSMKRLTALKPIQHRLPLQSKLQIYLTFFQPVLKYG